MDTTPNTTHPSQPPMSEQTKANFLSHINSRTALIWMVIITVLLAGETVYLYVKNLQLESALTSQSQSVPTPITTTPPL